jgi:hypothetical protein
MAGRAVVTSPYQVADFHAFTSFSGRYHPTHHGSGFWRGGDLGASC